MPNISDYFFEVQELAILEKKIPMQWTKGWILFLTKLW
jgi:hypothetical protein